MSIFYNRKKYDTYLELYNDNNDNPYLTFESFKRRVNNKIKGENKEKIYSALTEPVITKRTIFYKGKIYNSIGKLFEENDHHCSLQKGQFYSRLKEHRGLQLTQKEISRMLKRPLHKFMFNMNDLPYFKPRTTFEAELINGGEAQLDVKRIELKKEKAYTASLEKQYSEIKEEVKELIEEKDLMNSMNKSFQQKNIDLEQKLELYEKANEEKGILKKIFGTK